MSGPGENQTVLEELRYLKLTCEDVIDALRAQRELLRQRGMGLPPGTLSGLKNVMELEHLRALAATTALVNSSLDVNQVLREVMDTVIALTGAERGYIVLRDELTGEMAFRIARNLDRETIDEAGG